MKRRLGWFVLAVSMSCAPSRPPEATAPVRTATPTAPAENPAEAPTPVIPDTAAGRTLAAWLDAFNSADAARMKAFVQHYQDPMGFRIVNFREETGGFDLVAIENSEPRSITFVVKEKSSETQQIGWLRVKDGDPATIDSFTVLAIPPGTKAADIRTDIDAQTPARIVDAIAKAIDEQYVYPAVAKQMAQALRQHLEHGDDKAFATGPDLAFALTHQLQDVGHDRHVRVEWQVQAEPGLDVQPSAEEKARMKERLEQMNCGFEKTERLAGNIGYIKFDAFGDRDICGPKATAAFAALSDVDAVIFDLRDNGGGSPDMVIYVESYLFAKRTHIYDMYDRAENKTTPEWTDPDLPGKKLATQPVYVLTAHRTFSAAEAFAYDLQTTKRATIVGEVTGGGAHPTHPVPIDAHFVLLVPSARPINVVTKKDWEGTGVKPDVKVPAGQALEEAKQLAIDTLAKVHGARK